MTRLFRTADLRIGARGRFVQVCFQFCAQFFHGFGIGVRRHNDRFDSHQCAATEWQIDGGMVPITETDETAGRHREGHDGPSRLSCQHDDAKPRDPGTLRYIGSQGDVIVFL